jgi:hypothetical protein
MTNIQDRVLVSIKKNEIMSSPGKLMELEISMLSKISQTHNDKYYLFSLIHRI